MERKFEIEAGQLAAAIRKFAEKPENLENFENYLSRHFESWIEKWAYCPEGIAAEFEHFANM